MGRKRKYNTIMDIEDAFCTPDEDESNEDKRRRVRAKKVALNRLVHRQNEESAAAAGDFTTVGIYNNSEIADTSTTVAHVDTTSIHSVLAQPESIPNVAVATDARADSGGLRSTTRRRRSDMSPSQLAAVRERDRIRKAAKRRQDEQTRAIHRQREAARRQQMSAEERRTQQQQNSTSRADQRREMNDEQHQAIRISNTVARAVARAEMNDEQRGMIQNRDAVARATARGEMSDEQHRVIQEREAIARASQRSSLSQEHRREIQERDNNARATSRRLMTLDERLELREEERLRRRSRQYKKGYGNHEDFDSMSVRGNDTLNQRHYVSRFIRGCSGDERTCADCGAWKFPAETKKCCCMGGKIRLPPPREAPQKLRLLFNNPVFMQSIRAYNNAFAFTSMGASRSEPLQVDESVTRRGVYNFRVMGTVCHRMGSLLPPPGGKPMFAQIYINDPDSAARVASRIRMTDGLSAEILSDIDEVMEQHNPYAQQFLHAREILIERSRSVLEIARADRAQRQENEGKQEEDVHENLIDPEVECVLRLHVGRDTNPGTHNTPTASEVAAIIIDANAAQPRDIILYTRQGGFNRIYETNPHYDPLQYPLLHPYGESGWTYKMPYAGELNNANNDQGGRPRVGNQTDQNVEGDLAEWGYIVQYEDGREERRKTTMSLREFVAYLLYDRTGSHSLLLLGGRLTQQYCVDQWAKAEQERLRYIENNQLEFRLETIQGLTDAYRHEGTEAHRIAAVHDLEQYARNSTSNRGYRQNTSEEEIGLDANNIGRRLILPPSFTGGPRYMYQRFQDAMAIVRELGAPNLFITMTCNPKWVEIQENIRPGQTASDRPDIVARVFMTKLKSLCKDLDEGVLGIQAARIHVVEYQKRGLPHAHILLIVRPEDKPLTAQDVDRLVSAEIPDKEKQPDLYETVITCMLHGPCGDANRNSPCMKNGKCSKKFPKPLAEETTMAVDKYPVYRRRRRAPGRLLCGRKEWDNETVNQWVVPYNPFLSQKYNCHINVEVCATSKAVKYIYKYVYKGADMTMVTIEGEIQGHSLNEILQYLLARYISPVEACMRLFKHPTQGSTHNVVKLAIHLPGQSAATYRAHASNAQIRRLIRRGDKTTLTAFFMLCLAEPEVAGKMLYKDIPTVYRWDKKSKWWVQYKKYVPSIGRIVHVSPQDPERFYLRLLLCYRHGPTSFEDLRTIDGVTYATFHEAAMAAGYLDNDSEWEECLLEASHERMPYQLRQLFGIILVYSLPSSPLGLWERFKNDLSEDFQREFGLDMDDRKVEYKTLQSLDSILRVNGKTLENYGLPLLQDYELEAAVDEQVTGDLIQQELNAYPLEQLEATAEMVTRLNANQQDIFDQVISAIETPEMGGKLFFIDGPGGTGKSFLLEQMLAKIRLEGGIAVAVASSGIAATLLTGGRTAHSMFRIPLKPNEHSTCGISKQSQKAKLIRQARLIIWDEAPMMHRSCFEAVDRTFRDIMDNDTEPFGGKVIVFSGDHRQILPVLKNATRAETVKACFKASLLWGHLRQVHLTENMRVKTAPDPDGAAELAEFSDFLLQIGEGRFPSNPDIGEGDICIPRDMCLVPNRQVPTSDEDYSSDENAEVEIPNFSLLPQSRDLDHSSLLGPEENRRLRTANALIDAVYPEVGDDDLPDQYFVDRAILAPTNASVRRINEMVAERLPGETKEYLSNDSLDGPGDESLFEPEFLNSLNFSGVPPHKMVLKVGTPIIMIRNLNSADGLCNGTRLRVVALRENSIDATIMTGSQRGKRVFIPRIVFFSDDEDKEFPFTLRRKQFPVVPAFAMTINKAQGQSIHHVGIYLESPVFAHGQLYVALSRVTSRKAIKIAIDPEAIDEDGNIHTKNIVYREIFQ